MGCDIHFHSEIKVNGEWHHHSAPYVRRWYQLFAKMAGVRGDAEPIAEPRGFPSDAAFTTRFEYEFDGPDAHTPSWLTAQEAAAICEWYEEHSESGSMSAEHDCFGYLFGNGWDDEGSTPDGFETARWVFWFDN